MLEDLVNKYWNPNTDPDTKGGIATEFAEGIYVLDSTINNSTDAIDNTTNQQIYSTNGCMLFSSVTLTEPSYLQTLDISFDANVSRGCEQLLSLLVRQPRPTNWALCRTRKPRPVPIFQKPWPIPFHSSRSTISLKTRSFKPRNMTM